MLPLLSSMYRRAESATCRRLEKQAARWPFCLAVLRTGSSSAARIAMMAITTRSSIRVKPCFVVVAGRSFMDALIYTLEDEQRMQKPQRAQRPQRGAEDSAALVGQGALR